MIKRFDPAWRDGFMEEDVSGDYVLYEDYDEAMCNAQNEFDTLKRDYDNLVKAIHKLYMES